MIHERIDLHELSDNHVIVGINVNYNEEVSVHCNNPHSGAVCSVHSATLPSGAFQLLASKEFKQACELKLQSTSGEDRRPIGTKRRHIPSGGTILEARFSDTQHTAEDFAILRNHLAALTHMPIGNTTTDINASKPTRTMTKASYVQGFPEVGARPGSWKRWQEQLLPYRGQVGVLHLLDAQTFRASALWHAWTYKLHAIHVSDYSVSNSTQSSDVDQYVCSNSSCGIDRYRWGEYRVTMNIRIELIVPQTLAPFLPSHNGAQISRAKQKSLLGRLRSYSNQTINRSNRNSTTSNSSTTAGTASGNSGQSVVQSTALRYYACRDKGKHTRSTYCSCISSTTGKGEGFGECATSTAATTTGTSKESTVDSNTIGDVASQEVEVHRRIFDSRADVFTTLTTIKLPETDSTRDSYWFTEVLPEHYSIDFRQYSYEIRSVRRNQTSSSTSSDTEVATQQRGVVAALSSVRWTTADCTVHDIGADTNRKPMESAPSNWYMRAIDMCMGNIYINDAAAMIQRLDEGVPSPAEHRCFRSLTFELPPIPQNSFLVLTYSGNKRWVSRECQPIGASTGAQVPPSYLTYGSRGSTSAWRMSTESFLLTSALPDASMPFNVITLVSTLLAFFLGSFLNAVLKNTSKRPAAPRRERAKADCGQEGKS